MIGGRIIYRAGLRKPNAYEFKKASDPATPAQLTQRAAYKAACTAWVALTSPEKIAYNVLAQPLKITGFNLFVRQYILTPPPPPATYATWDATHMDSAGVLSNSDKTFTTSGGGSHWHGVRATQGKSTGKFCYETTGSGTVWIGGIANGAWTMQNSYIGANNISAGIASDASYQNSNVTINAGALTPANGAVLWVLDLDAGRGWIRNTGGYALGDPTTNSSPTFEWTPGTTIYPAGSTYLDTSTVSIATDPATFVNTIPAGWSQGWFI